jgi:hypothetical protein
MPTTISKEALNILNSFLQQKAEENIQQKLESIVGGWSGASIYKFSLNNKNYVLRMFADMENAKGKKYDN